jgi:hypothetical protein
MLKFASRTSVVIDLRPRRAELSAEHHHLTIAQQAMVATEALRHVDASLACAGLTSDEPTGRFYLALAQRDATPAEREAWLRLSTLQSSSLKTPIMRALAAVLESGEHDRAGAVRCAIAHSGGTITPSVLRAQLKAGPQRWQAANAEVAAAQTPELRCAWQILRLASHDELLPLVGSPKQAASGEAPQRTRRARTRRRETSAPAPHARQVTGRGRLSHGPRIDPAVIATFAA